MHASKEGMVGPRKTVFSGGDSLEEAQAFHQQTRSNGWLMQAMKRTKKHRTKDFPS
jgi:hypothetical protein